jgi:hypothetical protein
MSWPKLRALGIGLWLTEPSVLRSTAESLAKAQYAVAKDPHEAALLYAALRKKGVLQGLFRSSGNKKVRHYFIGRQQGLWWWWRWSGLGLRNVLRGPLAWVM